MKKEMVFEMELQFILNIIESTVSLLTNNYSICNAVESDCFDEYKTIDSLLKEICDCLCDESKKAIIEEMMKSTKPLFKDLRLIISRMKDVNGHIYID